MRKTDALHLAMIAALALATLGVALAAARQSRRAEGIADPDGWGRLGIRVHEGRGLVDDRGEPTAFRGPVVPLVFAAAAKLLGPFLETLQLTLCVFFSAGNLLVGLLAFRYYGSIRVTALSMVLYMSFWPAYGWFCHIYSEPVFTFLLALLIGSWAWQAASRGPAGFAGLGSLVALSALCRPEMYALLPIVMADAARGSGPLLRRLRPAGLVLAGFLVLEVPWVVRNCASVGRPVITAAAGTQSMFQATWHQAQNWQGNVYHDPGRFPVDPETFWRLPERERDGLFRQWAVQNVREAPLAVLMCVPKRLLMFFYQLPPAGWLPTTKSLLLMTPLYALAALAYRWSSREQRRLLDRCLIVIGVNAAVHAILVSEFRYSHPIQPYVFLMASVALVGLCDRLATAARRPLAQPGLPGLPEKSPAT